jgi:predicted alpha/beta hydrolase family esterase
MGVSAMNMILFVQGGGKNVHDQWDNKLVDNLGHKLGQDYDIRYPRMPNEADPGYRAWKPVLQKEFARLDDAALLVGHSLGGAMLIKALVEDIDQRKFRGVFLIAAPFAGKGGWTSEELKLPVDAGKKLHTSMPIYFYHGSDDDQVPFGHVELYAKVIPQAIVRRLEGRNHQINEDMTEVATDIQRLGK